MELNNKKVLLCGNGLVGMELIDQLLAKGADLTVTSMDSPDRLKDKDVKFIHADMRYFDKALEVTKGQDIVISTMGAKGSPKMTQSRPASFLTPVLQFNTNIAEASRLNGISWFHFCSSLGGYPPADIFKEDDFFSGPPSPNDYEAAFSKRVGELQLSAMFREYGFRSSIIRPSNIHGKYDDYSGNGMVIPSTIKRAIESTDKLVCWGTGTPLRTFVSGYDVARAIIFLIENEITDPVNVGGEDPCSIKQLVETIVRHIPHKLEIEWDHSKPDGDQIRVVDTSRIKSYGFKVERSLDQSIKETIEWYVQNKDEYQKRYDIFK